MLELIVYDNIEMKNVLETQRTKVMSSNECLIHALDMMDFMIALNKTPQESQDESIDWIILNLQE